jgi:hypothetical protein
MRRGLMEWNADELPLATLESRIARLRAAMKGAGLDAFIAYTNLARPSAVAHLTAFTPYWNEGLLLVPAAGRLLFATALSNRVADWIRSTNPVSDVVSTPRPGTWLGERLGKDAKRVGVLELDAMPSELAYGLAAAAPSVEWLEAGALFASIRQPVDASERRLLAKADAIATAALNQAMGGGDAGALAGLIEQHARLAGAEEVHIAGAPNLAAETRLSRVSKPAPLSDRFAVRASVAYKGSWIRRTRTFSRDTERADAWFGGLLRGLAAGRALAAQLNASVAALPGAKMKSWMAESCLGSYPLSVIASHASGDVTLADGNFVVLTVVLSLNGAPWIGSAPLIVDATAL